MTLLSLQNLTLHVSGRSKPLLSNINYTIEQGDFIILLGSNGSGKSSLLKLLTQQYRPTQGSIIFDSLPIDKLPASTRRHQISILTQAPEDSLFSELTIYENYLIIKKNYSHPLINHKKESIFLQTYLADYNRNLPNKLNVMVSSLSGGEKQALALAFCFLYPPKLLLLDEHTSALDPKASKDIMRLTQDKVAAHKITCILTTHDLDIARKFGERILMLNNGVIHKIIEKDEKAHLTSQTLVNYYYN